MPPEHSIRLAGPADLDVLTGLIAAFRDFLKATGPSEAEIRPILATLLADRSTEFLIAGEPGDGFAQIRYRLSVWNGSGAEDTWLEDIFVAGTARRNGVGRALVSAVIARAKVRGAARVQLDVNRTNTAAVALYEWARAARARVAGELG